MSNEVHVNVAARKIPAIMTHARKKTLIASPVRLEINPHALSISPPQVIVLPLSCFIDTTNLFSFRVIFLHQSFAP